MYAELQMCEEERVGPWGVGIPKLISLTLEICDVARDKVPSLRNGVIDILR